MAKKHNTDRKKEPNQQLTFWQTLQLGFYGVPDFKKALVYIAIGLCIVIATYFFEYDNTVNFIALIGCFISFMGFEQISKIIAGIRAATWDDYNSVVIKREIDSLNSKEE